MFCRGLHALARLLLDKVRTANATLQYQAGLTPDIATAAAGIFFALTAPALLSSFSLNERSMMFREMRRKRQLLPPEESLAILERMTGGTLALHGDNGYPYAVPVSYVYADGKIYFHSAVQGHKMDAIRQHPEVSFCVVEQDRIVPAEFTTYFRSVIVFGKARILTDEVEKRAALLRLAEKYSSGESGMQDAIDKGFDHLVMVEITVEHMTGKEAIELVRQKGK